MPAIQFKDIKNSETGKVGIVLGLGNSLNRHGQFLVDINESEEYCIISCNNIDKQAPVLKISHWMLAQPADASSEFYIPNAYNRYNRDLSTVFYYTDCLDLTPVEEVQRLLKVRFNPFDQRHNNSEPCGWLMPNGTKPTCCSRIIQGRKTIQEEFRDYCHVKELYGAGDTIAVHMISNAVMLGCNPIFVAGVDLTYQNGYVNNTLPETKFRTRLGIDSMDKSPEMVERILKDIALIKECAENIGTKIYCLDKNLKISNILPFAQYSII